MRTGYEVALNEGFNMIVGAINHGLLEICHAKMVFGRMQHVWVILGLLFLSVGTASGLPLRFNPNGRFKILQVADMHYANGGSTKCKDMLAPEYGTCSDLNTTAFVRRLIAAEKPDLIVFSGDNIFGQDTVNPKHSLNAAFAPAIEAQIPWAAVLGNHDQESTLSRQEVMEHIVKMDFTVSQVSPSGMHSAEKVDGFGNYHLEIKGAVSSPFENKSVLNLFLLDSGDYSKLHKINGYGWIQESQKRWFKETSVRLKADFRREPNFQNESAQALVYFHIPLVETESYTSWCSITGVKQEGIGCAQVNSGFLNTMRKAGDVRAVFNGHDHVNDFCGNLPGAIKMCYGGGVGYHAYGKAGWSRRARVVEVSLRLWNDAMTTNGSSFRSSETPGKHQQWLGVDQISTWKHLDKPLLPITDYEILWPLSTESSKCYHWNIEASFLLVALVLTYLFLSFILSSWWPCDWCRIRRFSPLQKQRYIYSPCKT